MKILEKICSSVGGILAGYVIASAFRIGNYLLAWGIISIILLMIGALLSLSAVVYQSLKQLEEE